MLHPKISSLSLTLSSRAIIQVAVLLFLASASGLSSCASGTVGSPTRAHAPLHTLRSQFSAALYAAADDNMSGPGIQASYSVTDDMAVMIGGKKAGNQFGSFQTFGEIGVGMFTVSEQKTTYGGWLVFGTGKSGDSDYSFLFNLLSLDLETGRRAEHFEPFGGIRLTYLHDSEDERSSKLSVGPYIGVRGGWAPVKVELAFIGSLLVYPFPSLFSLSAGVMPSLGVKVDI